MTTMRMGTTGRKNKGISTSNDSHITKPTVPTLATKRNVPLVTSRVPNTKSPKADVQTRKRKATKISTASIASKGSQQNGKSKTQNHKGSQCNMF